MNETTIRATEHTDDEPTARAERRAARGHAPPLWREAAEIGAILVAAGGAHALTGALGHRAYGGWLLVAIGAVMLGAALTGRRVLHRRDARG
ncbi:MAG TPA: hypothetical protein VGL93_18390 [Streptosporangiaceae bacterium]|jgi:fatty acid desaturase